MSDRTAGPLLICEANYDGPAVLSDRGGEGAYYFSAENSKQWILNISISYQVTHKIIYTIVSVCGTK